MPSRIENIAVAETLASLNFAYNPECTWILRWISYLSPIFYSFNALVNNEFKGTGGRGEKILQTTDLDNYGVWPSIGTLLGLGLTLIHDYWILCAII